ncbi:ATP-dependent Clp protease proteolytic subunit [Ehrlichia ruminantium]|uniref:ATP-dependent Clp protease proteolytic subunit n=1 Tax=Ehrlichia ruminantium TaxID=779 RepID=A0A170SE71_EHRRU|nr:ATP-dependent Clp protease proteolytic subunit [Ehrlichia ruminantium]GAT77940.1 ATP-dependent Clp protease proteolytic subunit [Ehrlichia ruminantium]
MSVRLGSCDNICGLILYISIPTASDNKHISDIVLKKCFLISVGVLVGWPESGFIIPSAT